MRAAPGGYADGDGLRGALEGVATLLLVPAGEALDRADQHRRAVDAAAAVGVERIVYLSFVGTTPDGTFTFGATTGPRRSTCGRSACPSPSCA